MVALTVWLMSEQDADSSVATITRLHDKGLLDVLDAAVARWPSTASGPSIHPIDAVRGDHAFPLAFWNTLFGLTFNAHHFGAAIGAAGASLASQAADLGIDPSMARQIRDAVRPGMAASFVYTAGALAESGEYSDEFRKNIGPHRKRLLRSNLTPAQELRARSAAERQ